MAFTLASGLCHFVVSLDKKNSSTLFPISQDYECALFNLIGIKTAY